MWRLTLEDNRKESKVYGRHQASAPASPVGGGRGPRSDTGDARGTEPAALPMPSLPDIDLPELPTDKEYDLQDIIGDEVEYANKEFPRVRLG